MKRLLQIGFEQAGSWHLRDQQLVLGLTRMNGQRNILYVFVENAFVLYVGKTTGSLESRMGGCRPPADIKKGGIRISMPPLSFQA